MTVKFEVNGLSVWADRLKRMAAIGEQLSVDAQIAEEGAVTTLKGRSAASIDPRAASIYRDAEGSISETEGSIEIDISATGKGANRVEASSGLMRVTAEGVKQDIEFSVEQSIKTVSE